MSPFAADAIRKILGYTLATVLTVLLFRLFGRISNGRQSLADLELWVFLGLSTLAVLWVRAARHVRRTMAATTPPDESPPIK